MAMKPNGKSIVSSDYDEKVMFFKDVSLGFISPGRIEKYLPEMKRGSVYKLNNFYGSINKSVFRVADHTATVSFSWNSDLSVLQDCRTPFDEDSFRFHSYEEFQANSDLKGDLYDVVGHMKLVNRQSIIEAPVLDEVEIAKARRLLIHIQSHEYVFIVS
ncbi:unnamed protein product [Brassica napus]|uniref:(rape) hypothetical protein n=1 Tax=Brassica napus TaxID=3708 RepID=A0A816QIH8_BRANA|nr:unnamed protein product [Brassica napus]